MTIIRHTTICEIQELMIVKKPLPQSVHDFMRESLGQILAYSYQGEDQREKMICFVGQYSPKAWVKRYIKYIKSLLAVDLNNINVEIS